MEWTVEEVPELRGYAVEYAADGNYYLSRRNELFHSENLRPPFAKIASIDAPFIKKLAANFRPAQRLLRFMVTNVIPLSNGDLFVTFDKSVGIVRDGKYQSLKGLNRPCRVLRSACAVDVDGDVFFGEYLANTERGAMKIYKYPAGSDALETAYTFPEETIRHVHGIYYDKHSNSMFSLTGDDDKECCFWQSFDGFRTTKIIGAGDETWRAVSVLFNEKSFFYGMDAEYRTNHIYKVSRENLERKSLGEVSGTVFYSKKIGADLFFATTAENAPSQIENVAALWHVDESDNLQKLVSFNKDRWHPTLFMFGTIHFPYQNLLKNELYFQVVGVREDNRTFRVKRG
jgi:hypothetical protein